MIFDALYIQIFLGEWKLNKASISNSKEGLAFFDKGDHINASLKFEEAIRNNPLDYSHYENAATSNYMTGNLQKALDQINKVINQMNPEEWKMS